MNILMILKGATYFEGYSRNALCVLYLKSTNFVAITNKINKYTMHVYVHCRKS